MTDTTTPRTPTDPVPGGRVDDPGASALQEGDFGLDGDLRSTMLAALESRWNADDPGATTLPDDSSTADTADGTDQPTPASPSSAPPREEDGAGVGGDAGEGAAPDDPASTGPGAPTPPIPPADDFSLDSYAESYFGTRLDKDQARQLFGVLGGLQNLTPAQREELDRVLAGGAPNQYPATTGQPVAPVTPAQPLATSPSTIPLPPRPDDEYEAQIYDKYIAPLAQATEAQLAAVNENIRLTTAAQQARERAENEAQITQASNQWREQHPVITDGEYDALVDRISRSGVFAPLVSTTGSVAAATQAALDQFFWADPNLRAKAIANIASGRAPGDPTQLDPTSPVAAQAASDDANRQARAASVAGGGGTTTPRGQAPAPKDAAGRKQALISEIAAQGDFS